MDLDLLSDLCGDLSSEAQLLSDLQTPRLTIEDGHLASFRPQQSAEAQPSRIVSNQTGAVITKIERIFESITDCILEEKKEISIELKSRPKSKQNPDRNQPGAVRGKRKSDTRTVTFPSKSPREAWKFSKGVLSSDGFVLTLAAALLRILELSHEALVSGIVTTKRDIYYREPELFMKQAVVDRYVDDIAYTLGVEREVLNVVAAAKGLVSGAFKVKRMDGAVVDYGAESEGALVPNPRDIDAIDMMDVQWILVIEKEATFSTLAKNQYWKDSVAGKGILLTAKGYPDIQSRQFLHFLSIKHPSIPILAVMDFDPDGIGIMSTYKHGSINLAHESNVAVPSIQWLGVRSSDFLGGKTDIQGLLTLSARDRRIATKMLQRVDLGEDECEAEWRRELQVMLMLGVKAEIQVLGSGSVMGEWLDGKLTFSKNS